MIVICDRFLGVRKVLFGERWSEKLRYERSKHYRGAE